MKQLTLALDTDDARHVSSYVREMEITYRICGTTSVHRLDSPATIVEHMQPFLHFRRDVEKFWVVCLNRKNRALGVHVVTIGTATAALAHPREVFRAAILASACAVACVHNHPSGDPAPSSADVQVTRQLREAAKTVDILLLDHVIIGVASEDPLGRGYYSFREAGML